MDSQAKPEGSWSTGLFGCFSDFNNCCTTLFCPCITFGRIAEIVDEGSSSCGKGCGIYCLLASFTGFACLYSCIYRSRMKKQHNIPQSSCNDCLVHLFCESCSLCQEYRELEHRGFDMSIGWNENMERMKNQGLILAPTVEGEMNR